jgi:hypothetical protein
MPARGALVILLGITLATTGCAKSAEDLSPFPCAEDHTCPGTLVCAGDECLPHTACDVLHQDCADEERDRCTVVPWMDGDQVAECVPSTGSIPEHGPCTGADTGRDGCQSGFYCFNAFAPKGAGTCIRLCLSDADCRDNTNCVHVFTAPSASEVGLCISQ